MLDLDPRKILADIERQKQELIAKEQELKQFMALGARLFPEQFATVETNHPEPERQLAIAAIPKARVGTARSAILETAIALMNERGYVQTTEVLEAVEASGVTIGAKDKLLQVSSILSRDKATFRSDRSKGWSLVNKKPDSAPTLPGFSAADAA